MKRPKCAHYPGDSWSNVQNQLIAQLPRSESIQLMQLCKPVELTLKDVLCNPGDSLRYVYFPVDAFISLIANSDGHPGLEVGMIGREGMLGTHVTLMVAQAPLQAVVEGSGLAWRVDVPPFRRLLHKSPVLQRALRRYVYVLMLQLSSSAGCLRFHEIEPRLA